MIFWHVHIKAKVVRLNVNTDAVHNRKNAQYLLKNLKFTFEMS